MRLRTLFAGFRRRRQSTDAAAHSRIDVVTYSCPKSGKTSERNEDAFATRLAHDGFLMVALADGVSRSHRPRQWAHQIVDLAVSSDQLSLIDRKTFVTAAAQFNDSLEPSDDWLDQEMQFRGSACTLVILSAEYRDAREWKLGFHAIGDSVAFLFEDRKPVRWFPPLPSEAFSTVTDAICTTDPVIRGELFTDSQIVEAGTFVCLASDAVAHAAVQRLEANGRMGIQEVFPFLLDSSRESFDEWVSASRLSKTLDDDDSTVVVVSLR